MKRLIKINVTFYAIIVTYSNSNSEVYCELWVQVLFYSLVPSIIHFI